MAKCLAMFGKVIVRQERYCQWDVRFGWCKIAIKEGFVDDVESSAAAWFFEIGGHTPDSVDFEVSVATTAQLFGCFKGGGCVFSEVAKKCESVVFGGSVKVWVCWRCRGVAAVVGRDVCEWPTWSKSALDVL